MEYHYCLFGSTWCSVYLQHQASTIFECHGLAMSYTLLMSPSTSSNDIWHHQDSKPSKPSPTGCNICHTWLVWGMVNHLGHCQFWNAHLSDLFDTHLAIHKNVMTKKHWMVWATKNWVTFKAGQLCIPYNNHGSLPPPPSTRAFLYKEPKTETLRLSASAATFRCRRVSAQRFFAADPMVMMVPLWHQRWHHADAQKKQVATWSRIDRDC